MTSTRTFIIFLDSLLLIIFLLLLSPRLTGLRVHEILGFVFLIPVLVHILFSWSWIVNSIKKILKNENVRLKVNFVLNVILFILIIIEIISGLVISQVILPFFSIKTIDDIKWRNVHNDTLNFTMPFIGIHLAMNWKWIIAAFGKRLQTKTGQHRNRKPRALNVFWRTSIITTIAVVIALVAYFIVGEPEVERVSRVNEIKRFASSPGNGIGQFAGETFFVFAIAFIARKGLRVRL